MKRAKVDVSWATLVLRRQRAARAKGLYCEPRLSNGVGDVSWALFIEAAEWSRGAPLGTGVHLIVDPAPPPGHARRPLWYSDKVTARWYELRLYTPGPHGASKLLHPVSSFSGACFWARELLPAEAAAWRLGATG